MKAKFAFLVFFGSSHFAGEGTESRLLRIIKSSTLRASLAAV